MANFSLRILFAHLLFCLDGLQRSFWNYAPQPLLSAIFPLFLEAGPKPSPIAHVVLRVHDLPNYTNSVDLSTTCLLPTMFHAHSTMNLTCSVDHPDYDQDDASPVESEYPHFYASLGSTPVQREDKSSPFPRSEQVEAGHAKTNLDPYGARGLSFCPVLIGVTYLHSLLHLYMLLMIPSLVNHWFEDVSFYESLNSTGLSGYSRLFHISLLTTPWYLVRYGLRRVLPCLYRRLRRVTHKSAQPSTPSIVLIRVDGEAVPVHFVEDHQARADVGERQAFDLKDLKTRNNRDEVSDGGDAEDDVQSNISDADCFIATGFDALPMSTLSQQGDSQGGIANSHDRIGPGPGPLTPDGFAKDSQHFVNPSDEQWESSPDPFRTGNEPLQHIEELNDFPQVAFPDDVVDDDPRDDTHCLGEQENSDQHVASSSSSLIDDRGLCEMETSSASLSATSSVEWQDMITPAKNVRFTVDDDVDATNGWQKLSSATHIKECTDRRRRMGPWKPIRR
ncbi:hypothetical protein JVU11DRAFT_3879 [Chiua virens]|nr:hypothetical protein JVU11DRAFT_3879 [Chiua virens]